MRWLLVTGAWPWPCRRGLQARTLQMAELLAASGAVTVLAPEPSRHGEEAPPGLAFEVETYPRSLLSGIGGLVGAAVSGHSLQSGLFGGAGFRRRFAELAQKTERILLQTARFAPCANVGVGATGDRLVVDLIDSLSLNFTCRAALDRAWLRPLWTWEARRLARDERRLVAASGATLVVAERDRLYLTAQLSAELAGRTAVVPLVLRQKSGDGESPKRRPPGERLRLVVSGNLGYFPTRHGLLWFLERVWPELRTRLPHTRLIVAGSRSSARLTRAIRRAGGELLRDPVELGGVVATADLSLAPLFGGSGTPMKLLEAIAAAVPVATTPFAAAGLEPELARCVTMAESPREWLEAISAFAEDPGPAIARAGAARRAALELYSPERAARALAIAVTSLTRS